MFEVTVKKELFASHALMNYRGACEYPHDHHWIIEAKFKSDTQDGAGLAIDFTDIDRALEEILTPYREKTLNEVEPFDKISPSAENFAKHIYEKIAVPLKNNKARLVSVTAWEDDRHGATYCAS